jgi:Family of unknown function (DUF6790)
MIFGVYLVAIAVCIFVHWLIVGKPRSAERVIEIALLYLLVIGAGVSGIIAFVGHAFYADATARSIGWQPGSPFQFEIAFANLSLGVLGLMCIRVRGPFWLATGLATSILFLGCNYGHLYQALVNHNYSPDNYGLINVFEIVWPAAVLILLIPYMRAWNQRRVALPA